MNSQDSRTTPKKGLFDLPAEIRLEIYAWVIDTCDLGFLPDPLPLLPSLPVPPQYPELAELAASIPQPKVVSSGEAVLPALLKTCRQIREEAMQLFFARVCQDTFDARDKMAAVMFTKPNCRGNEQRLPEQRRVEHSVLEDFSKALATLKSTLARLHAMGYPIGDWFKKLKKK